MLVLVSCGKEKTKSCDLTTSLVANIGLDGNVVDNVTGKSAHNHNGVFTEDRHGVINNAMLFSRKDSAFLDFGEDTLCCFPDNVFTISCWIWIRDSSKTIAIMSKRGSTGPWEFSIDNHFSHNIIVMDNWISSGATSVYGIDPLNASITVGLNKWMHVAYIADGKKLQVFVDGKLIKGSDAYNPPLNFGITNAHLIIGNGGGYAKNYFFDGIIDDIRIYHRALDANAIKCLASD